MIEFARARGAIPIPLTPLVGREEALATALSMLRDPEIRLVTLSGPGGVGKTRLALELAATLVETLEDGACFVPLETIADADDVLAAIAHALDVGAVSSRSLLAATVQAVRRRQHLLVLDNFEHLLAATPIVTDLLAAESRLTILVTSREALHVRGEHELALPPLALPAPPGPGGHQAPSIEALAASPAVTLFLQRARAARANFSLTDENATEIGAICARLDGLPLAIELAASRVSHLSPGAILDRIDRPGGTRLTLLTGGPRDLPVRLRTMRDAIAWSHDLLDERERVLFRRLAVFVGGFTIEAAAAVREADELEVLDGIRSLLAKSLVRDEAGRASDARFGLLETIREFGLDQLTESGEAAAIRQRHAGWVLAFATRAESQIPGPDDALWLARLEREHANVRAALAWLTGQAEAPRLLQLAAVLTPLWEEHAHYREGRHWLETALALDRQPPSADRLRVLSGAGTMAWYEGDFAQATVWHEEALGLARALGDRLAEATALNNVGVQAMELAEYERAIAAFEAGLAVARAAEEPRATMMALHNLAQVGRLCGEGTAVAPRIEEALALARTLGEQWIVASALNALGHVMIEGGDDRRAAALFAESLQLGRARGNLDDVVDAIEGFARLGAETGDDERAVRLFGAAAAMREAIGVPCSPSDIAYFAPTLTALRSALGADRFTAVSAAGRDLSLEEAMAEAVAPPDTALPPPSRLLVTPAGAGARGWASDELAITPREREVLRLLVEGLSDKEIGAILMISSQTATKHVGNLLHKLGVPSRTAAATLAVRRGFV
ncbi:MAG: AAA family ATPase [Chloroflexia bacterium]|nr:AAA family ATPase [Chloroflexia bacterium]